MKQHIYCKKGIETTHSYPIVESIFKNICDFIELNETSDLLNKTHIHGATSTEIQNILNIKLETLGFTSEKKGLFKQYISSNLRPDFFKKISENDGIIVEVERGKTLDNNMNLLDIWKCHICKDANYLFLIIPEFKTNQKGSKQKIFDRTINRLASFFEEDNYINVDAVFILGY
ncbi:hypothetical protein [Acinetobacter sp. WCHAc010052]|uniref:hypothetical protein n=1 Tax=Acinetobacter sp. WCHAc010052 TaxID=2004647 RepID=UPI000B3D3E55|nr:hypothetical protein [Acinetobacter sp. WCHAc010052]AXY59292.1 hypothetical protein CDG61_04110 [Acinetobacter sp. WCHAc010052]